MTPIPLWQISYHLCGALLLGPTPQEPLGPLPIALRTAALLTAQTIAPEAIELEIRNQDLVYGQGVHQGLAWWRFREPEFGKRLARLQSDAQPSFNCAQAYVDYHDLNVPNDSNQQDEHWAERRFLEIVFIPTFGLNGLRHLRPQVPFTDSKGKRRRIDFVLEGRNRYAIEVEGRTYHGVPGKFNDEKERQRELTKAGYQYFPLSWEDIQEGEALEALRVLIDGDPLLASLAESKQAAGEIPREPAYIQLGWLLSTLPERFPTCQLAALELLCRTASENARQLTIAEFSAGIPTLTLALFDSIGLIERAAILYGLPINLPKVEIYLVRPFNPDLHTGLLAYYLDIARLDGLRTQVAIRFVDELPEGIIADYFFATDIPQVDAPPASLDLQALKDLANTFQARVQPLSIEDLGIASTERPLLDYFARRYFLIAELKPEQLHLIQQLLRQESGLGILPTGFGKSLVFQLSALLSLRTTLVISPLKALIQDQLHSLRRLGFTCVEGIVGMDTAAAKVQKLSHFQAGKYRLLYISPERLQIKGFYQEIQQSLQDTPVGSLVIDEAHCISEWGHDFRPAYLQIARLRQELEYASGRSLPILALTATASEPVRRDILAMLELSAQSLVQLSSSDRPKLSLSVHRVNEKFKNKEKLLAYLISQVIPQVLHIPPKELLPCEEKPPYPHAGVVFAIYADPHGRTTFQEGTQEIASRLRAALSCPERLIQTHSSKAPSRCPLCGSHTYLPASTAEAKKVGLSAGHRCEGCGMVFMKPVEELDWQATLQRRQDDFQDNQFPLLVATKGYGMGIDKRNIRFVIHHAFASGLEAYYQEAGRSGRDGQHSHVAMIYIPPVERCVLNYINTAEITEPPCISDPKNFKFHKCPFGLKELCDFGRQARFIKSSYLGVDEDCQQTYKIYKDLQHGILLRTKNDEDSNKIQLGLYRLQQLGIVQAYTLTYGPGNRITFDVEYDLSWQPPILIDRVRSFLEKTGLNKKNLAEQVDLLRSLAEGIGEPPWDKHQRLEVPLLKKAIGTLQRWIYQTVPLMRYEMLRNEFKYAQSSGCRRIILRGVFDLSPPTEEYRCNFCDVCVPNLDFQQEEASIPLRDAQVDEIARMLPEQLQRFDTERLPFIVQKLVDQGAVVGMLARVTHYLEGDITNLSALYIAGCLARHDRDSVRQAIGYLRLGFEEGRRRGVDLDDLLLFYREACLLDPEEAFGWLTEQDGPFDDEEGLAWLYGEAIKLFGTEREASRALGALATTRRLSCMERQVISQLIPHLQKIQQDMEKIIPLRKDDNDGQAAA